MPEESDALPAAGGPLAETPGGPGSPRLPRLLDRANPGTRPPLRLQRRHGLQAITRWYDDLERLDALDWKAIHTTYWRSTEDPDLTRRKQAEFLVHRFLPWDALLGIACYDAVVASDVERRLAEMPERTTAVRVRPDWYYDV